MDLRIWSPFTDFEREWRFDLPRLLGEPGIGFRPSVDVVKGDDELTITVELPGIDPDDVEVSLDRGVMTIKGVKSEGSEVSKDDRYVRERSYGEFLRRMPLPEGVSADKIAATFDKGVLTLHVTLPEEQHLEPRKIEVTTG